VSVFRPHTDHWWPIPLRQYKASTLHVKLLPVISSATVSSSIQVLPSVANAGHIIVYKVHSYFQGTVAVAHISAKSCANKQRNKNWRCGNRKGLLGQKDQTKLPLDGKHKELGPNPKAEFQPTPTS
jgi:hypothetical protein